MFFNQKNNKKQEIEQSKVKGSKKNVLFLPCTQTLILLTALK